LKAELIKLRTNAKVNLFLRVIGKRADGYHELETVLHGVGLADDLEFAVTDTGEIEIDLTGPEGWRGRLPAPQENLVYKAAQRLIERGAANRGIRVTVRKRIPIAAGLGGGSGNAAGALVVLNEIWNLGLDHTGVLEVAGGLGADVPYCIEGGTALATSRGEDLTPLPSPEDMWFVLGISHDPLPTSDVYAAWDEVGSDGGVRSASMTLALGGGDAEEIASLLHNDLEKAVFSLRPEVRDKKRAVVEAGALGACVAGSGPTVFGIAQDEGHARTLAKDVGGLFDRVEVVRSKAECIERLS
jgi:4-diphosphocytidyl-2-C-methyl-D-erythritol kinase